MTQYPDPRGQQPDWTPTEQYRQGGQYPQGQYPQGQYPQGQYGQDPYAQDPYGQGQYSQDPRRGQPRPGGQPPLNPFGSESDEAFGIAGTVLALIGGIVLVIAFTGLEFMRLQGASATFGDVHDRVTNFSANGFAEVYFGWLAWVLLIVAVLAAVGSSFPSPALRFVRIIGVVAGVVGAGLAFLAIQISDSLSYVTYLEHQRIGFYLTLVGFVLTAIGAGIGPRKV